MMHERSGGGERGRVDEISGGEERGWCRREVVVKREGGVGEKWWWR